MVLKHRSMLEDLQNYTIIYVVCAFVGLIKIYINVIIRRFVFMLQTDESFYQTRESAYWYTSSYIDPVIPDVTISLLPLNHTLVLHKHCCGLSNVKHSFCAVFSFGIGATILNQCPLWDNHAVWQSVLKFKFLWSCSVFTKLGMNVMQLEATHLP